MGDCWLKFGNKPFTLHTAPLTSGQFKQVVSGIHKNHVKQFAHSV